MRFSSTYLWLLASAVVAAAISWQALASAHPLLATPTELIGVTQPTAEQLAQMRTLQRTNDTYALMMFAAVCLAAGAPLYTRGVRWPLRIVAILAAVATGALTGAAMGGIGFYLEDRMPINGDALVRMAVRWMGMLAPTGIAAALITIVCQRAWRKSVAVLTGGIIGSVFVALAYALIAAVLFQTENSDSVLPYGTSSRFLLFFVAPLLIWITIAHQEANGPKASAIQPLPKELEAA